MDHATQAIDRIDDLLRSLVPDWHTLPGPGCRVSRDYGVVELLPLAALATGGGQWPGYEAGARLSVVETWWYAETGQDMYVDTGRGPAGPGIYRLLPVSEF